MKGIDSTGAPLVHVPGWVDGWMEVKAVLRIAYSNQKLLSHVSVAECNKPKSLFVIGCPDPDLVNM
jgi:hypothetical protein